MTKIMIIVFIIIVFSALMYMKYFTNNSPSIVWNNYDKQMNNKITEINSTELQEKIKKLAISETTFKISNCNELIIQKYNEASQDKPNKEITITDKETINNITSNLNKLPEDWEMFVSFAPTISHISLTFICEQNKSYRLEIYWSKLKTPGTTFFAEKHEEEKNVIDMINKLLDNK